MVDNNSTVRTVFPPIGARPEQRPTATAAFAFLFIEQRRFQVSVQRQDSGPEVFTDQRPGNALDTDAGFPAVVQQDTVTVNIVAAFMHQPLNGTELLIGQMWYWVFQSVFLS